MAQPKKKPNAKPGHNPGKKPQAPPAKKKPRGGKKKSRLPKMPQDPMMPQSPKRLRNMAIKTMNRVYAPEFQDLTDEEKRVYAINEKRQRDNAYYLSWLKGQSDELEAHAQAADQSLQTAQGQIHGQNVQAYQDLRTRLVTEGAGHSSVSDPNQASSFDISAEQLAGLERVANERTRTTQQLHSQSGTRSLVKSSNFALMAAAEANRVADMWSKLGKLSEGRHKLRLDRAAKTAQEVARLLDKEIEKGQIRGELRNQAAQAGLDKAKLGETKRHNLATEGQAKADAKAKAKGGAKGDEVAKRQKKQESRKATSQINSGVSYIGSNPQLAEQAKTRPIEVRKALIKQKMLPIYAQASVDIYLTGKLSTSTKKALKAQGYIIPPSWR